MSDGSSKTRVLFITHSMTLGGAPRSLNLLLESLDPERYERVVACIYPAPDVAAFHAATGAEVVPAYGITPFPHTTGGWLRLWHPRHLVHLLRALVRYRPSIRATRSLIEKVRPDLVHVNSLILVASAVAAREAGVPLVWHVRESIVRGHVGLRRRWLAKKVRTVPDAAVFLSQDDMLRMGPPGHNWHVVPNWTSFDPPQIARDGARARLSLAPLDPVVLLLGGFSRLKGTDVLLLAWPLVRASVPGATCVIAGVVPPSTRPIAELSRTLLSLVGIRSDFQECERLLRSAKGVVTLPFRTDTEDLFAASDVLAFPARAPHFPRPVVEAFAHRVPVVASDIGTVRDVAGDGTLGILVASGNPQALAEGLIRGLSMTEDLREMTDRAFREGKKRFTPEAGVNAIEGIYRGVLG